MDNGDHDTAKPYPPTGVRRSRVSYGGGCWGPTIPTWPHGSSLICLLQTDVIWLLLQVFSEPWIEARVCSVEQLFSLCDVLCGSECPQTWHKGTVCRCWPSAHFLVASLLLLVQPRHHVDVGIDLSCGGCWACLPDAFDARSPPDLDRCSFCLYLAHGNVLSSISCVTWGGRVVGLICLLLLEDALSFICWSELRQ